MIGWAVKLRPEETGDSCAADCPDSKPQASGTGCWMITQLLAETASEEALLLHQFQDVLKDYDTIIEFNGDRFDLPYLREKYESYGMENPFDGMRTVDLYQELRPFKSLLSMSRLNQKSVEQFLHITREDPYNGGELIDVYRSVRSHTSSDINEAIRSLFLHNYEDVLGMLAMTPVIAYPMISHSSAPVTCRIVGGGISDCCLEASFPLCVPVPADIDRDAGPYRIRTLGDTVFITIPLNRRVMYHFFPDYKDYYYLPEEDTAMHKSVACFVDPSHRQKATAQNCYVKKEGIFLPQTEERFLPSFRSSYKDRISWFEYQTDLTQDEEAFSSYIHSLISGMYAVHKFYSLHDARNASFSLRFMLLTLSALTFRKFMRP
jgi:hypothetical protein